MAAKRKKAAARKPAKGFSASLGPLDDALAGFWFSVPAGHSGHCRLNESERRALLAHLESQGFAIVPAKRRTKR